MNMEPTEEERKAIASLKRLARRWPKSLWLFSGAGSLCVMKRRQDGERYLVEGGGMDTDAVLATIDIPNDGGDW